MKRFRVVVTKADIRQGQVRESSSCPLALAVQRTFPQSIVGAKWWTYYGGNPTFPYLGRDLHMSEAAIRFVQDFDNGITVRPSVFYLEPPR